MMNKLHAEYLIISMMMSLTSCIPPTPDIPKDPRTFDTPQESILEIGQSLPYFTDFTHAMIKANLSYILEEKGPFTFFIPNANAVHKFLIDNNISSLNQLPENKLSALLLNHIIHGSYGVMDIPTGYYPSLAEEKTTNNPIDLYINTDILFALNGNFCMGTPNITARNGMIHSITSVIKPPDILDHISNNEDFSMLLKSLSRKDLDQDYLLLISQRGPYTVLAPTNEAFKSLIDRNPDWESIDDIPSEMLSDILKYHIVIDTNILFKNLNENTIITSNDGNSFTVKISFSKITVMDRHGNVAHVIKSDIQASNGIIHQVDRVLFP